MINRCPRHHSPAIKQTWIRDGDPLEDGAVRVLSEEPIDGIFAAPVGAVITVAYIGCACIETIEVVGGGD